MSEALVHAVAVAGGGPTGLMLAAELALAGIDVGTVERRAGRELDGARAGGLHARTIELLDQRGVADRFLAAGKKAQVAGFSWIRLDIGDFPTRHNYGLALWQREIERILGDWVNELRVPVYRPCEVIGLSQDDSGVDVALGDGRTIRCQFLIGCDGGRSLIRKAAGIEFHGSDATISNLIAEVKFADEPPMGSRSDTSGIHVFTKLPDGLVRVLTTEPTLGRTGDATMDDLREALRAAFGTDFGVREPKSLSRFTDASRQAAEYRDRRVLIAGDAAHVHYPVGGQGLNLGIHDAVNLGWKLAFVVKGECDATLLDTYRAERHPVTARALRTVMAAVGLLRRPDDRTSALRETLTELLRLEEPRKYLAATISGLDVRYGAGDGHPLRGRRMPDLDIRTPTGSKRVYELLHAARPVFLNFAGIEFPSAWRHRVDAYDAQYEGRWELLARGNRNGTGFGKRNAPTRSAFGLWRSAR
jgi:2-polyprenyl-6-methoxyphenol hydroxylase-like FAD-dependent oxidoreductase